MLLAIIVYLGIIGVAAVTIYLIAGVLTFGMILGILSLGSHGNSSLYKVLFTILDTFTMYFENGYSNKIISFLVMIVTVVCIPFIFFIAIYSGVIAYIENKQGCRQ